MGADESGTEVLQRAWGWPFKAAPGRPDGDWVGNRRPACLYGWTASPRLAPRRPACSRAWTGVVQSGPSDLPVAVWFRSEYAVWWV